MITEQEILRRLLAGKLGPDAPITLRRRNVRPDIPGIDAMIDLIWQTRTFSFAVECKADSSPKSIRDAADTAVAVSTTFKDKVHPLVVVPWLAPEQTRYLEQRGVSGIDLNGNCVITVPGELLIFLNGRPNAYPQSRPIRNVYRGDSSLVSRVFLLRPTYRAVGEIRDEIRARSGEIALSTTSKVLSVLESDLIVGRESGVIRLLQPEKLLEQLAKNYRAPAIQQEWSGRIMLSDEETCARLKASAPPFRFTVTGAGSVNHYAAMPREPLMSLYCDADPDELIGRLGVSTSEDARFPNLQILTTTDATVYFDRRLRSDATVASPVQTWLELANGDKRQQDAAEQVKGVILDGIARKLAVRS